jgi:demethylmenaquinone methyltransferase/2-methoxy-6-polyprenyl-1,4-benzoquinol methylase
MFGRIARRYDTANRVLSAGLDMGWRRRLVSAAAAHKPDQVLDLATGSGDVAIALKEALPAECRVLGADFCRPMLEQAERKQNESRWRNDSTLQFEWGDGMALHLPDATFDVVTIAFGLRNMSDRGQALREMHRVLRPGGLALVLEFSQPAAWFKPFYYFYLQRVLPLIGGRLTGDADAYRYLNSSIQAFPTRTVLEGELRSAGFKNVSSSALTGCTVALHRGIA